MSTAVEAHGLRKEYGALAAVEELTFAVETGEILGYREQQTGEEFVRFHELRRLCRLPVGPGAEWAPQGCQPQVP